MDLSNFDTTNSGISVLHLRAPTGQLIIDEDSGDPVTISLLGSDSDVYQKLSRKQNARRLKHNIGRRGGLKVSPEELEEDALEILVACTVSWDNVVFNGTRLECNPANIRKLYSELPFVREQVDEFVAERENFLGN